MITVWQSGYKCLQGRQKISFISEMYHARADMNDRFIQALNYKVAKYDANSMMCGNDDGPYRRASHINHTAHGHS